MDKPQCGSACQTCQKIAIDADQFTLYEEREIPLDPTVAVSLASASQSKLNALRLV